MLGQLNDKQQQAVNHIDGALLVLAGAGSGKTKVVTERISNLLRIGVPASEILAVTFTNKAAQEMKSRIQKQSNYFVLTCTFHSLGARILRESISYLGFHQDFTIYDEEDVLKLLKECFKLLNLKEDKASIKAVRYKISEAKANLILPEKYTEDEEVKDVYNLYEQRLKSCNALDFDDLLFKTVLLLREFPEVLQTYQRRWRFILVDEYQDTNTSQYVLMRLLSHRHGNLFAVGDPDQSIYSWRGANINNILNFEEDFENTQVVRLEQNYRSTEHILSAANSLIAHNESRYEKKLWSSLGEGEKVAIEILENEKQESSFVVERILQHLSQGYSLNEIVIFYRTNAQSRNFEDLLLKENLPYTIVGGMSFYQRREIKDILAYLKCACFEADIVSFARAVNLPKRGLGPSFVTKMIDYAQGKGIPVLRACRQIIQNQIPQEVKISPKQRKALEEFMMVIDEIKELAQVRAPLKEILKSGIVGSNYLSFLKLDEESYVERKENLDELVSKSVEWEMEALEPSLNLFLEELSLKSSLDETKGVQESLKLMTLHNGKGLEFDVCFIVGMEEDVLPHINSKDDPSALEEERRLCYVGMTRAKKQLYMTASKYRFFWGNPKIMSISRFLNEIDKKHVQVSDSEGENFPENFEKLGSMVIHKDFGQGIIRKVYNTSLGETYDVYFSESKSMKSLVAKYAKLKMV